LSEGTPRPRAGEACFRACRFGAGHRLAHWIRRVSVSALGVGVSLSTHLRLRLAAGRACHPATRAAVPLLFGRGPQVCLARLDRRSGRAGSFPGCASGIAATLVASRPLALRWLGRRIDRLPDLPMPFGRIPRRSESLRLSPRRGWLWLYHKLSGMGGLKRAI
jgi:hypothetical protein